MFAFFMALGNLCGGVWADEPLGSQYLFPKYAQEVAVEYAKKADAVNASIELTPLYQGKVRAISCRWDDNSYSNMPVRELLDEYGVKATWYLNSNSIFYLNGSDYRPTAKGLLENGHSIGGHGYNHPYIGYTNRNRMFREMAEVRIEWESELDIGLNSYAFSFVNFKNVLEGPLNQQDIIRCLERAGFYHSATFKHFDDQQPSDLLLSIIMPPENQTFEDFKKAVDWAMSDPLLMERFLCVSHSMHAWYGTPAVHYGLDELRKRVEYLNSFQNNWQCNQNEYAAYRYQALHTTFEKRKRKGKKVTFSLDRPEVSYLNDDIPLTLELEGVSTEGIVSVTVEGQNYEVYESFDGRVLVDLPHGAGRAMPLRVGHIDNEGNVSDLAEAVSDADFPNTKALLSFDGKSLRLQFDASKNGSLSDVKIAYRLPLAWEEGLEIRDVAELDDGRFDLSWKPGLRVGANKYMGGKHYFVAQIDFKKDGAPSRLFATCSWEQSFSESYPRDHFLVVGPFDTRQLDIEGLGQAVGETGGRPPVEIVFKDGARRSWKLAGGSERVAADHFDPEIVPTSADWYLGGDPRGFILYSTVESSEQVDARLVCDIKSVKAIFLNGKKVNASSLDLKKGSNQLVIVHEHDQFDGSGEHAGAFLRLVSRKSGKRLDDVRYLRPSL
ncbi:polysaccharide deacetylase family protein [Pelagicoccus mobilis]|uniref:Polysaccharide deacetylase family protein n=1 Tax=Pelagicoccus mobilis TaxID=415221 RepID=A0A934RYI4_9BACT|nr:polysaccharide deacetylase family protein [Pelagicoccus mobilis]MBK1877201.1 polysaccharide deacetylase family protein [Pelagicoccus mobilis]